MSSYRVAFIAQFWSLVVFVVVNPCTYVGAFSYFNYYIYHCNYEVLHAPFVNGFVIAIFAFLIVNVSIRILALTIPISYLFSICAKTVIGIEFQISVIEILTEARWEILGVSLGSILVLLLSNIGQKNCKYVLCLFGITSTLTLLELGEEIYPTIILAIISMIGATSFGVMYKKWVA